MAIEIDIQLLYKALTVTLILVVTYVVGRATAKILRGTFRKTKIPETETIIVVSIAKYFVYLAGIFVALGHIGVPVDSFLIALGLVAAVLGIISYSALSNIMSGYFLRLYGSFDVNDVIEIDGKIGRVKDLNPLQIVIETPEHLVYSIPNSEVMKSKIYNFTKYKSEYKVELEMETSQQADLEEVKMKILEVISTYPQISYEKPVKIQIKSASEERNLLKVVFYVSNFEIVDGAKDFVANSILNKAKTDGIPFLNLSSCNVKHNIQNVHESNGSEDIGEQWE